MARLQAYEDSELGRSEAAFTTKTGAWATSHLNMLDVGYTIYRIFCGYLYLYIYIYVLIYTNTYIDIQMNTDIFRYIQIFEDMC